MIGNKIIQLDRVDSTNIYAGTILDREDHEEGTVFRAIEQFAGKGQQDHKWESESGKNLTFTVLLKPVFLTASRQFMLNKAIALGVVDFVNDSLLKSSFCQKDHNSQNSLPVVTIKWPNDIYAGDKKIGGILIEHRIMGQTISATLAGIGININQTRFDPEIPNPVSMIHLIHNEMVLADALSSVCQSLDHRYETLKEFGSECLDKSFNQHLLGLGQWRNYSRQGFVFEGKIIGVDDIGRLKVENRDGKCLHFDHKEVEYIL